MPKARAADLMMAIGKAEDVARFDTDGNFIAYSADGRESTLLPGDVVCYDNGEKLLIGDSVVFFKGIRHVFRNKELMK